MTDNDELPDVLTFGTAAELLERTVSELMQAVKNGAIECVPLPAVNADSFVLWSSHTHGFRRSTIEGLRSLSPGPSTAKIAQDARAQRRNATDVGFPVSPPGDGLPPAA